MEGHLVGLGLDPDLLLMWWCLLQCQASRWNGAGGVANCLSAYHVLHEVFYIKTQDEWIIRNLARVFCGKSSLQGISL